MSNTGMYVDEELSKELSRENDEELLVRYVESIGSWQCCIKRRRYETKELSGVLNNCDRAVITTPRDYWSSFYTTPVLDGRFSKEVKKIIWKNRNISKLKMLEEAERKEKQKKDKERLDNIDQLAYNLNNNILSAKRQSFFMGG